MRLLGAYLGWRTEARDHQRRERQLFFLKLYGTLGLLLLAEGAFVLAYVSLFGWPARPGVLVAPLGVFLPVLAAVFFRFVRPLPFRGKAPEEAAADAFFAKEDVRSDDHRFEKDLTP